MIVRVVLAVSGVVGLLFGAFFIFGADAAISSYNLGEPTLPATLFARATGISIAAVGFINLLSLADRGSPALYAVVTGNLLIHALSIAVDFSADYERNAGVWIGLAIHVVFIVAFGYVMLNWKKLTEAD